MPKKPYTGLLGRGAVDHVDISVSGKTSLKTLSVVIASTTSNVVITGVVASMRGLVPSTELSPSITLAVIVAPNRLVIQAAVNSICICSPFTSEIKAVPSSVRTSLVGAVIRVLPELVLVERAIYSSPADPQMGNCEVKGP